jgi:agmatine deiminase
MIADHETNVVYVADTLEKRFPSVHRGLHAILQEHGIPLRIIPGTRDIWCRDYMPIQVSEDRFVQFRYAPDYLTGKYRHLIANGEIGPGLPFLKNVVRSENVLDGGNIVAWNGRAFLTEKIFRENPGLSRLAVVDRLKRDLGVPELILIPQEPFDPIGHSDGMVCWLDERTVLINDYSKVSQSFRSRMQRCIGRHALDFIELPYDPASSASGGIPSATGNWMNFLRVRDVLVVPTFGTQEDQHALGILCDLHPRSSVETIDCHELAAEGGVLHCVTWQSSDHAGF